MTYTNNQDQMRNIKTIGTVAVCFIIFLVIGSLFKAIAGFVITALVAASFVAAVYTAYNEDSPLVVTAISMPAKFVFAVSAGLFIAAKKQIAALADTKS
jgi:hypothetical protein